MSLEKEMGNAYRNLPGHAKYFTSPFISINDDRSDILRASPLISTQTQYIG